MACAKEGGYIGGVLLKCYVGGGKGSVQEVDVCRKSGVEAL